MIIKTNWKPYNEDGTRQRIDYINVNRIISNIKTNYNLFINIISYFDLEDMGETRVLGEISYCDYFENMEKNLKSMLDGLEVDRFCRIDWSSMKWDFNDINRIEENIEFIYNELLPYIVYKNLITKDGKNLITKDGKNLVVRGVRNNG